MCVCWGGGGGGGELSYEIFIVWYVCDGRVLVEIPNPPSLSKINKQKKKKQNNNEQKTKLSKTGKKKKYLHATTL